MKKRFTLFIGLLVAAAAAYALPTEEKIPIEKIIKIEVPTFQEDATTVSVDNVKMQVDDGVNDVFTYEINRGIYDLPEFVIKDEGEPMQGHRRILNPVLNRTYTPKGMLDKSWCTEYRCSAHALSSLDTGFSLRRRAIEHPADIFHS